MNIIANLLRYVFLVMTVGSFMSMIALAATTDVGTTVSSQLTAICVDIKDFVGILVVVLLALGAVLYAISHVLPAAGNIKGNLQGWALNMVVGAIVALIIYFLAPWIAGQIVSFGNSGITNNGGTGIATTSLTC